MFKCFWCSPAEQPEAPPELKFEEAPDTSTACQVEIKTKSRRSQSEPDLSQSEPVVNLVRSNKRPSTQPLPKEFLTDFSQILQEDPSKSLRITFWGSPNEAFCPGAKVVVSFPGVHGFAWNFLTKRALEAHTQLLTTCIFLPNKDSPGYGYHHVIDEHTQACHCLDLYGHPEEWGCSWYHKWTLKTKKAAEMGCQLFVVTKSDGTLGWSQQGEVRFLDACGCRYETISIHKFALRFADDAPAVAAFRERRRSSRVSIQQDLSA